MSSRFVAPAIAGAMLLCVPTFSIAKSFQDCTYDCRAALEKNKRLCVGKTGELRRACLSRAEDTFSRCVQQCTRYENQRLLTQQAREKEAAERQRLRAQPR